MEKGNDERRQRFSSDPEQDLRIENEILKLKLQAERGARFVETDGNLPPEIEAEFLKNVELFESTYENAKEITVYECLGSPSYKKIDELKPREISAELKRLEDLMQSKNINLGVLGQYEPSLIYKFITEELFFNKVMEMNIPGFTQNFIYEEFHPNHTMDIGTAAEQFINHWFEKKFNEYSYHLSREFITGEGKIYKKAEVLKKLENCLDSYKRFSNVKLMGSDVSFEWNDKVEKGLGHAEGGISYDAEIENGEIIHIEGPYKLYMINEFGGWDIFYFVFPGFSW